MNLKVGTILSPAPGTCRERVKYIGNDIQETTKCLYVRTDLYMKLHSELGRLWPCLHFENKNDIF